MFGLFEKKASGNLEERLPELQKKKDWAGLAKAYYELGAAAMDAGDLNRAALWLHRADTIYSAKDEVYEKVGDKLIDDCSDRIGELEEAALLCITLPAEVAEQAEVLGDPQLRLWGLLSIARLVRLGERLAALPGCETLGRLGWAVDMMFKSFRTPPSQEEYGQLMDICNGLYELGDSEAYFAGGHIEVAGGAPFQVFDLNGMQGVLLNLNLYVDNHLRLLAALSQGAEELPRMGSEIVGCALLPDYYVRTMGGEPENIPQIQNELKRIWSDYAFIASSLTWELAADRLAEYKRLDILAR